jgi:hypothetical protein
VFERQNGGLPSLFIKPSQNPKNYEKPLIIGKIYMLNKWGVV